MIILIEPAEARLSNPIAGLWRRLTGKERLSVSDDLVLGMKVLKMSVPMAAGGTERTRKRVLNTLRELRINTVLLREDFPRPEWFEMYRRPDGSDLMGRMLSQAAKAAAGDSESILIYLRHMDREAGRTLSDLCMSYRHVMLLSESEGAIKAAQGISERMGVSLIVNPADSRIKTAKAAVIADVPQDTLILGEDCVAVAPSEDHYERVVCRRRVTDVSFMMTDGSEPDIPEGYPQKALISEAILRGGMSFGDICIKSLEISP